MFVVYISLNFYKVFFAVQGGRQTGHLVRTANGRNEDEIRERSDHWKSDPRTGQGQGEEWVLVRTGQAVAGLAEEGLSAEPHSKIPFYVYE